MKDNTVSNLALWLGDVLAERADEVSAPECRAALEQAMESVGIPDHMEGYDEIVGFDEKSDTEQWLICWIGTLTPDKQFGDSPSQGWSLVANFWSVEFNLFIRELAQKMEEHVDYCVDEKLKEIRDYYECGDGW